MASHGRMISRTGYYLQLMIMDADSNSCKEKEPVNIGKIIETELRQQERTVTWLSRKIHCDRRNVYDIFSRTSIDTDLLYKISIALNTDFFACFSTNLKQTEYQSIIPLICCPLT